MSENILVSGAAGYIGSHTVLALIEKGYKVHVIDNMTTGSEQTKSYLESLGVKFTIANIQDEEIVSKIIKDNNIKTVLNFAGSIIVSESVEKPMMYYKNNFSNTISFLDACTESGVDKFIFSSTASVYGNANSEPVTEESTVEPMNPYADSKLMVEKALAANKVAHPNFNYGILRYFNVAGADYKGRVGQMTKDATHLIKVATQKALNKRDTMAIFGTDYDTPDGTCIRDYIHITDLAQAHVDLLTYLETEKTSNLFNCGYGEGYSVKEVITKLEEVVGYSLDAQEHPRRAGDPVSIIANNTKIKETLGWQPKHNDLEEILTSALEWEKTL
tara:strand:- start:1835 stop:2827 length:993 start_codon:yes stop_codon:yes gene_type:complete